MPIKPFRFQPVKSRASLAVTALARRAVLSKESEEQKEVKEPEKDSNNVVKEPKSEKPSEPTKVNEPQKPAEPNKPSKPAEPAKPSEPSKPNKPAKPEEAAADVDIPLLELKIQCSTLDAYWTLVNMLGVVQWNCNVGHSATTAGFFDGDGADKVKIDGLPDGDYEDMADELSSYGDGFMGFVGPYTAVAYNTVGIEDTQDSGVTTVKRTNVYPPEDEHEEYDNDDLGE